MGEPSLRAKMLPVLDRAVESGALTRDEAFEVLDRLALRDAVEATLDQLGAFTPANREGLDVQEIYDTEVRAALRKDLP